MNAKRIAADSGATKMANAGLESGQRTGTGVP